MGVRLVRTQVGDRYVVEEMRAGGYNLGGEQSGHVVFLDHNTTGDGLLTGAPGARDHAPQGAAALGAGRRLRALPAGARQRDASREKRPIEELPEPSARRSRKVEAELGGTRPRADPLQRHRAEGPRHGRGRGRGARARATRAISPTSCAARSAGAA